MGEGTRKGGLNGERKRIRGGEYGEQLAILKAFEESYRNLLQ